MFRRTAENTAEFFYLTRICRPLSEELQCQQNFCHISTNFNKKIIR